MLENKKADKIIKIISINIVLFLIAFLIVDMTIFYKHLYYEYRLAPEVNYIPYILRQRNSQFNYNVIVKGQTFNNEKFRPIENINSSKSPIVIFGCSFAYGAGLNDNQTLSAKLAQFTGRPVYNRAHGGWGTQHMLYQLKSEEFYQLVPKPEYVIYVFMGDHVKRIQILVDPLIGNGEPCILYKNKKGKLVLDSWNMFLLRFPTFGYIKQFIYNHFTTQEYKTNLLKFHLLETKKEINKHWNNTKFVILLYEEWDRSIEKDLENNGIKIIHLKNLVNTDINDKKYTLQDGHPNENAWNLFTPALIKELKI